MLHAHLSPGPLPSRMQLTKDGKLKHFLTIEGLPPLSQNVCTVGHPKFLEGYCCFGR
nr:hypothetical protein [Thiothrix subterranea]